ncbi:hypothetical protein [Pinibacter soli]|uniref:Lipoprotein n=1 Tax=Pinibacter soli TaxID=3044211 RepID=A0ABT6R8M0_9BACT|nr:hypothetical protein [Pinibacter soli]MDI3318811.1 hypothetical protein [Pinibacter soli]
MKKTILILSLCYMAVACNNTNGNTKVANADSTVKNDVVAEIPEKRSTVNEKPVMVFEKPVADNLNKWKFSVKLYETNYMFKYKVEMQYQEVTGADTITFPNLGYMPRPVMKQGTDPYSCIIGFKDNNGEFKPYKLVIAENDELSIKTLKHYSVTVTSAPAK